jgi:geranylgeranyl pyrophosphate synthase
MDDPLDATGTTEAIGKPAAIDAAGGKQTFLTVAHPHPDAEREVAGLIRDYTDAACRALESLAPTRARDALIGHACALSRRVR